jgi:AcrR family transcriptional regulator
MASKVERPILEMAITLFASHGYFGAGIREIAAAANVTPGSIFRLFHTKDKLFKTALEAVVSRSTEPAEFERLLQSDKRQFALSLQKAILRWYGSVAPQSARLMLHASLSDNAEWRTLASSRTSEIAGILAESLQREVRKSKVRKLNALAASRTLILTLFSLKSTHTLLNPGEKEREAVARIIEQWIQGLNLT